MGAPLTVLSDRNMRPLVSSHESQEAEKKAGVQWEVPFSFGLEPPPMRVLPTFRGSLLLQLHLSGNSLTGMVRVCLLGDSNPVR